FGETSRSDFHRGRIQIHQRDLGLGGWVRRVLEVPAGARPDIEMATAEMAIVVSKESFGGATPDEAVAPPQNERVVHGQRCSVVERCTVLLCLRDFVPGHWIPSHLILL